MKALVLAGLVLAFLFSSALRSARAQAATEYGLTAASGASSTSGVAKVFNQKLNVDRVANGEAIRPATVVHNTRPAGSKVTSAKPKNGQSTSATAANSASKQGGTAGDHAKPADPFGMTIVGAERR